MRAAEDAPGNPFYFLERRHGFAEIVERGVGVRVERSRVMLRAGARLDYSSPNNQTTAFQIIEQVDPQLAADEHVVACKQLIADVHAAGSWRAYARLARKDAYKVIQRLRSLEARARATTSDVFLRSAFRLPDEMLLKVLGFWRATTSTGVPL